MLLILYDNIFTQIGDFNRNPDHFFFANIANCRFGSLAFFFCFDKNDELANLIYERILWEITRAIVLKTKFWQYKLKCIQTEWCKTSVKAIQESLCLCLAGWQTSLSIIDIVGGGVAAGAYATPTDHRLKKTQCNLMYTTSTSAPSSTSPNVNLNLNLILNLTKPQP